MRTPVTAAQQQQQQQAAVELQTSGQKLAQTSISSASTTPSFNWTPTAPLCSRVYILEPTAIDPTLLPNSHSSSHHSTSHSEQKAKPSDAVKLSNEYGKSSTCEDLKQLLLSMGYQSVCADILADQQQESKQSVQNHNVGDFCVVNLCDGCESDGYPGISILNHLQQLGIPYTGSNPEFYVKTTSKPVLKRLLIQQGVPTSDFLEMTHETTEAEVDTFARNKYPLIVKPSISYASISITDKSVVFDARSALEQAHRVTGVDDGVFIERFLAGREFTVFVVSLPRGVQDENEFQETGLKVFAPVERVFNSSLGTYQRILAFDRYWDGYTLDNQPGTQKQQQAPAKQDEKKPMEVYKYAMADQTIQHLLKDIAVRAFRALGGNGYGRVDMRSDAIDSKNVFVLEVNANCGIAFNPNEFTSTVSEILRISGESVHQLANTLIGFGMTR